MDSDGKMESSNNHHRVYNCSICDIRTRTKKAICFCKICKEYLCTSCEILHRSQKEKRTHKLIYGLPMILRRNSLRPLTRCTTREIKRRSECKGKTQRSTVSHRRSLVTATVKYGAKDNRNASSLNRGMKRTRIDDNDTSGEKDSKRSSIQERNKFQVTIQSGSQSNNNVIKNSERIHTSSSKKLVAEMKILSKRKIDIRFPKETYHPCISCCAFLPSGELIIGDQNNKALKLLDKTLTPRDKIKLSGPPLHYMAVTSDTDVLIAIENLLQFVQVLPKPELKHVIHLKNYCRGLAVANGLIYIIINNENKVRVIDYHGQFIRFITDNHGIALSFEKPMIIAVNNNGKLYILEWLGLGKSVIHCFSSDGNKVYKYEDAELKYGTCIYVEGDDNILLFGHTKGNVYMVDKTGKKMRAIFTERDGLYVPRCMGFRATDNSFVIGGYTENLLVFMVE